MTARLIIVNGGSSSGKTGIVRCLQAVLDEQWLAFGVREEWAGCRIGRTVFVAVVKAPERRVSLTHRS